MELDIKSSQKQQSNNIRVRNVPEKIARRMNSSPKNKKRKAMNYRPFDKEKVYSKKKKTEKVNKKENPI